MTIHWDVNKDLLDGEKPLVENSHKLKRSPERCCGNEPRKRGKHVGPSSHKAMPEPTKNPVTGKWFFPKSSTAMDSFELRKSRKAASRRAKMRTQST